MTRYGMSYCQAKQYILYEIALLILCTGYTIGYFLWMPHNNYTTPIMFVAGFLAVAMIFWVFFSCAVVLCGGDEDE